MNVNCSSNENICEATITVTFLKQTTMKYDMKKFHLTQCKCRIWNLINLLVIRKSSMCFFCFCHSKYHKSIMPPLQCDFLEDVYFFLWSFNFITYLSIYPSEKKQVYTGDLKHYRQTLQLIKFYLIKKHERK